MLPALRVEIEGQLGDCIPPTVSGGFRFQYNVLCCGCGELYDDSAIISEIALESSIQQLAGHGANIRNPCRGKLLTRLGHGKRYSNATAVYVIGR